jgi:hypothetical protein
MDERVLAERLITYDTSNAEGLRAPPASSRAGWRRARSPSPTTSSASASR